MCLKATCSKGSKSLSSIQQIASHAKKRGRNDKAHNQIASHTKKRGRNDKAHNQIASHAEKRSRNDNTHDFYFSKNSNNNLTPKAVPALCGANSVSP